MDKLVTMLFDWIKAAPKWVRAVVPLLLAAIAALYLCTSCGVVQRVQLEKRMTRETKDTTRLIISSTSKTTVRTFGVPLTFRTASRSESVGLPLVNVVSIGASADAENSAYQSKSGSARRNIAKRAAVNSANELAYSTKDRDLQALRCAVKQNPGFLNPPCE